MDVFLSTVPFCAAAGIVGAADSLKIKFAESRRQLNPAPLSIYHWWRTPNSRV